VTCLSDKKNFCSFSNESAERTEAEAIFSSILKSSFCANEIWEQTQINADKMNFMQQMKRIYPVIAV
jgi:hypothetical protein